ncbi:hypothetical protein KSF_002160 [Reticulibacter mediterranei]|uniref:Uncharacterized protein n=1 Tax=Reticulibacter mediterranei TaxID=2778369 RepID=A0A8J3IAS4_9CHLR|nr:hypothetical protein [Reticulibacter mediterranei]GHO90168.1 hypothetical protein KSF_002160 [Reticulibacter mediterranei]
MNTEPSTAMSKLAPGSIRICIAFVLTAVLLLMESGQAFANVVLEHTSQYMCDNKCYGRNQWDNGASEYYGAYTEISVAHLQCASTCDTDGLIDDEMWLFDDSGGCHAQGIKWCWVEVGYMMHHDSSNQIFFAYDMRPAATNNSPGANTPGYLLLGTAGASPPPLTPVPVTPAPVPTSPFRATATPVPTSLPTAPTVPSYGNNVHFMIIKDMRSSPSSFLVFIYSDSMTTQFVVPSSPNPMTAHKIRIGQELHGSSGASAEQAIFTHNFFAVHPITSNNVSFTYKIQTQAGMSVLDNNPPYPHWDTNPSITSNGGTFSTRCCSLTTPTPVP